jgi:cell division protein FtsB
MKLGIVIVLSIILIAVFTQVYFILKERNQLKTELNGSSSRLENLLKENNDLQSEIEYFSHPENLEKELRLRFNYKKPGEKMMIIVP